MALAQKYNYTYERGKFNVYTQQVNFIQAHTRGEQVLVKNYSSLANNTNKEARPSLVSYNTLSLTLRRTLLGHRWLYTDSGTGFPGQFSSLR